MNRTTLDAAIAEAKRFLARTEHLRHVMGTGSVYHYPKESGAVRRASMDLTRALADLRRP